MDQAGARKKYKPILSSFLCFLACHSGSMDFIGLAGFMHDPTADVCIICMSTPVNTFGY
jgi:hypothetical protein